MIKRVITKEIKLLAKEFPVVAILGPRQSGKTTIAKHIFSKHKYVSMEDLDTRDFAVNDPRSFFKKYNNNVIIDEAQRVPELFSYLQTHVDEQKQNGSFVLTGSHNYLLMEKISQSLAGRVGLSTLLPLSIEELAGNELDVSSIIFRGFYPRVIDQAIRPYSFFSSYIGTYLERDIRLIQNIVDYNLFVKFLKLIAGRAGQILNMGTIAADAGISSKTAENWLSILETSYIIYRLRPFAKNYNKRIVKHPKLYFYDTGLLCHLLEIKKAVELDSHYLRGGIFENFIISDVIKHSFNSGQIPNVFFWKDNHDNEIDLIVESGTEIKAIEIKSGQTINSDYLKNLKYLLKQKEEEKIIRPFLIYGGDSEQEREGVKILSWKSLEKIKKLGMFN